MVVTAEASKKQSDITLARNYNNVLVNPIKNAEFTARLDAIVVPLRTWYINVRGGITLLVNCNSTTTKSFSPSTYNWNHFYVGKSSLLCPDLENLRDSDNQISTLSLSNTAPFNGTTSAATTGNNSGLYPDVVLTDHAPIYNASATPAKIMISGLDANKTYNIRLFGYTSSAHVTSDKDTTYYTI